MGVMADQFQLQYLQPDAVARLYGRAEELSQWEIGEPLYIPMAEQRWTVAADDHVVRAETFPAMRAILREVVVATPTPAEEAKYGVSIQPNVKIAPGFIQWSPWDPNDMIVLGNPEYYIDGRKDAYVATLQWDSFIPRHARK